MTKKTGGEVAGAMRAEAGSAQSDAPEEAGSRMRYREDLRDFHRRSWELELFVSGAVLFALFQLLSPVDDLYARLDLQVGGSREMATFMGYYYAKLVLYTLIVGFLVHLAARAFWVGLIGLDSAFPKGPDWSRLDYGPAALGAYRRIVPRPARFIVRTDAFASVIFSFTFSIALIFAMTIAFLGALAALAKLLAWVTPLTPSTAFRVWIAVWAVFYLLPILFDKLLGRRLDPEGSAFRFLRGWIAAASWLMLVPLYGVTTLTLFSRVPKRWMYAVFGASLFLLLGIFFVVDIGLRRGVLRFDSHRFVPVDAAGNVAWTVDPSLYDEWRDDPGPRSLRPSIPAPVTRGPYLRVFVPLVPDWVAAWVEDHCPELEPLEAHRRDGEAGRREQPEIPDDRVAAARECLLAGHSIEVDGRPVRDELLFGTHPESGAMGLIGYLDLRGRERGRHEISIRRLAAGEEHPERRYRIPFWR